MNRPVALIGSVVLLGTLLGPTPALAGDVQVLFDVGDPEGTPFPSNLFTVVAPENNTGLRVSLPLPDCTQQPSNCELIEHLNTLDGFNLQPRLSVPFSGPIDVDTATSETVFLISLGDTLEKQSDDNDEHELDADVIGINQVVWDPETETLHMESDEFLEQHTRYALIVTREVRDATGRPVSAKAFTRFRQRLARKHDGSAYHKALQSALRAAQAVGVRNQDIAAASVFNTQTITSFLEKARDQVNAAMPEPPDFQLGFDGSRTVFPVEEIENIVASFQVGTGPDDFENALLCHLGEEGPLCGILKDFGTAAFGKYRALEYRKANGFIPPIGTRKDNPRVLGANEVFFNLFLPLGPKPQKGWPVVIFGLGSGPGKDGLIGAPIPNHLEQQTASSNPDLDHVHEFSVDHFTSLAELGFAVIAINAPGLGLGQGGLLTVELVNGDEVTFPSGGRGIDRNGDGVIGSDEGYYHVFETFGPDNALFERDGNRQMIVDLLQLVRVIEAGMVDVDGDGRSDLDTSRILYEGGSLGTNHGALFLAIEPAVSTSVLQAGPHDSSVDATRLSYENRAFFEVALATLKPPLTNVDDPTSCLLDYQPFDCKFDENLPLRNRPPVTNDVPKAMAIQAFIDKAEWINQSGSPVAYAVHLRKKPLLDRSPPSFLIQFARGDLNVPNPGTVAFLRAGNLADRATLYRHDLAFTDPKRSTDESFNPHTLIQGVNLFDDTWADIAEGALRQARKFQVSEGMVLIDPDGLGPLFEVPIVSPLPEDCGSVIATPEFTACE